MNITDDYHDLAGGVVNVMPFLYGKIAPVQAQVLHLSFFLSSSASLSPPTLQPSSPCIIYPGLNRNRGVEVPEIWWPLLPKRQNLPRVSEDIGIQSIDTSQRTDRSRSLTSARDLMMRGRSSRN